RLHAVDAHYLWVSGRGAYEECRGRLQALGVPLDPLPHREGVRTGNTRLVPYLNDMPAALAAADLVVGRAGAMSLAELAAKGLPAVLVPYPHAAENHQEQNARALAEAGAAVMIRDDALTAESLVQT